MIEDYIGLIVFIIGSTIFFVSEYLLNKKRRKTMFECQNCGLIAQCAIGDCICGYYLWKEIEDKVEE